MLSPQESHSVHSYSVLVTISILSVSCWQYFNITYSGFFFSDNWWKTTLHMHTKPQTLYLAVSCQNKGQHCVDVGGVTFLGIKLLLYDFGKTSTSCVLYVFPVLPTLPKPQCHNSVQCQLERGRNVQQLFAERSMVPMVWCYSWGLLKHTAAREYPFWSGFKMSGLHSSTCHK